MLATPSLPVTDPVLIVAIATFLFLVAPLLAERAELPGIVGLLVAGALFGPHGLGILARDPTIVLLGTVGLLYLVFLSGLELDLHRFAQYRRRSIVFGLLSFGVPMLLASTVMPALGFGLAGSLLMGSIVGSHTLLAYPIASRLGLVKNTSVIMVVGGTLVCDTLALTVLAVVAGSLGGGIGLGFWMRLLGGLALYVALVWLGVPRLGRWFFRNTPGQAPGQFVFLLVVLFASAYLATLAGAQPIIGAFLAGLALNSLIPNDGPHMSRVRFVGNALLIPFFLLSVGMLVDPRVLAGSGRIWMLAATITLIVHVGKFTGAWLTRRIFNYSAAEGMVAFGLSVPQAAATLAVTFVGLEIGLFDDEVVNAVVMMIVVTGLVGPSLVERFGARVALEEESRPFDPGQAPQRILVPVANPATAPDLMELALVIRDPSLREPIYPLTVVPADLERSQEQVALAEGMLSSAVSYAAAADVPVVPMTRMDHNFASGIARGVAETRSSTIIIGWDGRRSANRAIFGTVLDQLLELTKQQVLVAKLGHPLNTTQRIVVVLPRGTDHQPGFPKAVRTINRMASQLGARIVAFTVDADAEGYREPFERTPPRVPTSFERADRWGAMVRRLQHEVVKEDLVVVVSARHGAVSWVPALEKLPRTLSRLVPESFIMLYPSEVAPSLTVGQADGDHPLPPALAPHRTAFGIQPAAYPEVIEQLLASEFAGQPERIAQLRETLLGGRGHSWEVLPGVAVAHARVHGIDAPLLFLGTMPEGTSFPEVSEPARLFFILLSPEERPDEHLSALASIANLVRDPARARALAAARSFVDLVQAAALD